MPYDLKKLEAAFAKNPCWRGRFTSGGKIIFCDAGENESRAETLPIEISQPPEMLLPGLRVLEQAGKTGFDLLDAARKIPGAEVLPEFS